MIMRCDFCGKEMDQDETGIMLLEFRIGGHMLCAIRYKEAMKQAVQVQRLSGRVVEK